ncbi:helix-turn-helix domain-containing protein [Hoeflea ulvae]|uniref:Helix-turn-helix domain-containing protein n=1 Tax=Hoeflea ulvae TaxID=2983764 RepID=A0ABT3YHP7_9HYPH|nr:helix-turn-helix domain-containing protein [Hoeflea ulvae]MCY0095422.1 helix-turn-helix domain-containing protein [Hoeflea ulvae]
MKILDIADIASGAGLPPSTLRYYEEIGLISSIGRHGLRRQYEPETLMKLSLIALGKAAGYSLQEIAGMFGKSGEPVLSRPDLHARADQLEQQIHELTVLKNAIRHVADCPAPSHMECPTFRRLIRLAGKRSPAKRKPPRRSGR